MTRTKIIKRKESKVQNDDDDPAVPSKGEQARETGKMLLEVLEAVAQQIPVPGVGLAVKMAKNLIQTCEASLDNFTEVLKKRVKNLAIVLVNELKHKKAEEIKEKSRQDVEKLFQSKLDEITSQNALRVFLFRRLNEDKVRGCVDRLTNALESFNLACHIENANALEHLSQQIITFHKQQKVTLDDIQKVVENIGQDMKDVRSILARKKHQSGSSSPRRGNIPPAPLIFFGRDTIVNNFADTLVSKQSCMARICLLGPGGMGKTSIPCVKATSVSLFKDTLYDSLGVSTNTGDPVSDIIQELESSPSPVILLLDNFETSWNLDSQQEVQETLSQLAKLPHIALFVTMRSSEPPGNDILWESVHLEAIDRESSFRIYTEIDSAGSKDPELTSLLDEVGHMPLAVTLMARLGKRMGSSPAVLLDLYKEALYWTSEGAQNRIWIFDSPDAAKLLAILALLLVGTTLKALCQWCARDIVPRATITSGLGTLLDTSLVEKREGTFVVLPVVRSYILDPKRFPKNIRESIIDNACMFLKEHNASPGETSYLTHLRARSLEETNLQRILLETTLPDPKIIDALLILSGHQQCTRPRMEVVQHALELSKKAKDQKLYTEALYWNGRNLLGIDHFEEVMEQFRLARKIFFYASEPKGAAKALYWIGSVPGYITGELNRNDLENAAEEFQSLSDPRGIAICQTRLAYIWGSQPVPALVEIREFCISNDLLLEQAECMTHLSWAYKYSGKLKEAKKWALTSLEEWKRVDGQAHGTLATLGEICISLGDYDEAVEYLKENLKEKKAYGSLFDIAGTLFQLGRVWMKKGRNEDARAAFAETLRYHEMFKGSWKTPAIQKACTFYFDKLEDAFQRA
ncbi:hypothetical protein BDP27DRAFT_1522758 [Rhodocollybia butyracea]|uniref:Uncharacterized protein n=1 Tax=Rhodocollybia butyracea TaxID=206335 RepID=A0A9P5U7M9_9AGAR|nr:hypothetical protein BDP27DRAFT_1522758 [Rhodocollybia butyracea]